MFFQVDACNEAHELKEKLVAKIEVRFHCHMSSNNGKIKWIKYKYRGNPFPRSGEGTTYWSLSTLIAVFFPSWPSALGQQNISHLWAASTSPPSGAYPLCTIHITRSSRLSSHVISSRRSLIFLTQKNETVNKWTNLSPAQRCLMIPLSRVDAHHQTSATLSHHLVYFVFGTYLNLQYLMCICV